MAISSNRRQPGMQTGDRPIQSGDAAYWSTLRLSLCIFAVAFLVRLGLMVAMHPYDQPLRVEIHHVALSLSDGHGFANPYPTPTGPTALYTPGCPLILAGIYRIFGSGRLAEAVTYVLDMSIASLVFALLPLASSWLGLSRQIGVWAGFLGAAIPVYLLNEYRSITAVSGALCLVCLTLLSAWAWRTRQRPSERLAVMFGAAWGAALLISPNLLFVGIIWLIAASLHFRTSITRFALGSLLITLLILAPWVIRNRIVLGAPILTRSGLGLELWIANNDYSSPTYGGNERSQRLYQPFVNQPEAMQMARRGEASYMHQRLDLAMTWIESHPQRFLSLTGERIFLFWLPVTYRISQSVVLWVLEIGAILGLYVTWSRNRDALWILGTIWLGYPLVYYFVQLDNPYRYPMYWSVLLLAVYGCSWLAHSMNNLEIRSRMTFLLRGLPAK